MKGHRYGEFVFSSTSHRRLTLKPSLPFPVAVSTNYPICFARIASPTYQPVEKGHLTALDRRRVRAILLEVLML